LHPNRPQRKYVSPYPLTSHQTELTSPAALHFKLSVENDAAENFDDAQFLYLPQLDPNRDRALIDMLPDFLVEEITFPRPQAAKFYARVMKALNE
jgi:hypothetical protein